MISEWTPPKRRKLVQKLHPTGYYQVAMQKIKQSTPDQREAIKGRIEELMKAGELTEEENKSLIAEITAMS